MTDDFNPEIISVIDDDGKEYQFEVLDQLEDGDFLYYALLPVQDEAQDIVEDDGELVILKLAEEDGEEVFITIEDDDEYEKVAAAFTERLQDLFEINEEED